MERDKRNHKFIKEIIEEIPTQIGPQTLRVERARWKKKHLLAAIALGIGAFLIAKKLRSKDQ